MEILESKYLYLALLVLSISYPLAQSFEKRIQLYRHWKAFFRATLVMMLLFIPWDVWFTARGVWWFNNDYISGIKLFQLPVEEWLFFIIVPYACIFIYEVLNHFIKKDLFYPAARVVFALIGLVLLGFVLFTSFKYYTSITFVLAGVASLLLAWRNPLWIGRFLLAYLVCWLPFLLVNGALTGNFTNAAVVNYNEAEIIGLRVTTIPIEDSVYNMLMLLIVVAVYERYKVVAKDAGSA